MIRNGSPHLIMISSSSVQRFDIGTDSTVLDWEYLIFIARKAG